MIHKNQNSGSYKVKHSGTKQRKKWISSKRYKDKNGAAVCAKSLRLEKCQSGEGQLGTEVGLSDVVTQPLMSK